MTGDELSGNELAYEIHRRQGFFVLNSTRILKVGDIRVVSQRDNCEDIDLPFRVIGTASPDQRESQFQLVCELKPGSANRSTKPYSYLVEAAD